MKAKLHINYIIKLFFLSFILCFCFVHYTKADDKQKIDSLSRFLKTQLEDTTRLNVLKDLAWLARNESYEIAINANLDGIALAQKTKNRKFESIFYRFKGVTQSHFGEKDRALASYIQSLNISEEIDYQEGIGFCYDNIGVLKFFMKEYEAARINFETAYRVFEKEENLLGIGYACTHLSWVYNHFQDFERALSYATKALEVRIKMKNTVNIANTMRDIGNIYKTKGDFKSALQYYQNALSVVDTSKNLTAYVEYNFDIADLYFKNNDFENADKFAKSALLLAIRLKNKRLIIKIAYILHDLHSKRKNFVNAYSYLMMYASNKDSLLTEEKEKEIARMFENLNFHKKEQENDLLKANNLTQRNYILGLAFVLIIAVFLLFFVIRANRKVQNINRLLKVKNEEILFQSNQIKGFADNLSSANSEINRINKELHAKNLDFMDSINYAKSIQSVILSIPKKVDDMLSEKFIFFQPRDIVSGDFYYFHENNNQVILAVADCTGHGVPGAFMSMISNEILNEIIINRSIHAPDIILNELHKSIRSALKQDITQNREGLDIAVCTINFNENIVQYAGAKLPLYVFIEPSNKTCAPVFQQFHASKSPIGGEEYGLARDYSRHEIYLEKGLTLSFYIATDGYSDQFGGSGGKKFMVKRFKELMNEAQTLDIKAQEKLFEQKINTWKGDLEQVDDMTVLGFKIKM